MSNISKRRKITNFTKNLIILLFGNALYAFAVEAFIIPSGLVMGGVTGISILVDHFGLPFPVSYLVLALNIILYIIGAVFLGRHFIITTGASSVLYPIFLRLFEILSDKYDPKLYIPVHDDLILCSLSAGLLIGCAVGFLVRIGASTGGSDIPPLVVNKLTGFPVGTGMLILDASIVASQFIVSDLKQAMYGIIMVVIYSYVINQITVMGMGKVQISVVSEKIDEVRMTMLTTLGRGITLLDCQRGLSGKKGQMIVSVVYARQLAQAKKIIMSIDPSAFITITQVSEVNGNGFSFFKGDKKLDTKDVEW